MALHLTGEQRVALTHPCLLSFEVLNPVFARKIGAWSEVLTVNTGYE
jgi:hypothetical protein